MRRSELKRSECDFRLRKRPPMRRTPLKKRGRAATLWDVFRGKHLIKSRDQNGLVACAKCGAEAESLDLHHIIGRATRPDLYFVPSNLIWLCRPCHQDLHSIPLAERSL